MLLNKIDESNFIECFSLKLKEGQEKFCSHPIKSLAQAYIYYHQCTPFGIYEDDIMVGYVMVIYDYDEKSYNIWHFMIDEKFQGKGYAKKAMPLILEYIKSYPFGESNIVYLTVNKENNISINLYKKFNFVFNGIEDEDEYTMELRLN